MFRIPDRIYKQANCHPRPHASTTLLLLLLLRSAQFSAPSFAQAVSHLREARASFPLLGIFLFPFLLILRPQICRRSCFIVCAGAQKRPKDRFIRRFHHPKLPVKVCKDFLSSLFFPLEQLSRFSRSIFALRVISLLVKNWCLVSRRPWKSATTLLFRGPPA